MWYLRRVPMYVYVLGCGSVFRSQTPSQPTEWFLLLGRRHKWELDEELDMVGVHYFPCVRCMDVHAVLDVAVRAHPPLDCIGRRISDRRYMALIDSAMLRDRVRWALLSDPERCQAEIAAECGVSARTVWAVRQELGIPIHTPESSYWDENPDEKDLEGVPK